jgi:hypothetical protein
MSLTVVNAAKAEFRKRPHFRHSKGAGRGECVVLPARVAVLQLLQDDSWLELPRRQSATTPKLDCRNLLLDCQQRLASHYQRRSLESPRSVWCSAQE